MVRIGGRGRRFQAKDMDMFTHAKPGTEKLEYRVRKVTRYIVTEYHAYDGEDAGGGGGSGSYGEFASASEAHKVAHALANDGLRRMGWDEGDPRVTFPTDEFVREQEEEYRQRYANKALGPRGL